MFVAEYGHWPVRGGLLSLPGSKSFEHDQHPRQLDGAVLSRHKVAQADVRLPSCGYTANGSCAVGLELSRFDLGRTSLDRSLPDLRMAGSCSITSL